jgi:hypothetical protein
MATQSDLARGWMQKGDSDRLNAERTVQSAGPYDTACFHCQQAVEKYLTPYAVQLRYDADFWPDQTTARQALDVANRVRAAVLTVLPPSAWPSAH